ncbi:MAG: deoxyribonuclease IV, partial [Patescibacteria group bacterium]
EGLIFHLGSCNGCTREEALKRTVAGMHAVLKNMLGKTQLIMENSAGSPRCGSSIEELSYLYNEVKSPRLKVCLDTQHLFASGIDDRDGEILSQWLSDFDKQIGMDNIVCMHANDSKTELGSCHDKHENIGAGFIGEAGFKNILKQPLLAGKPWILEVPGMSGEGPDRANRDALERLG